MTLIKKINDLLTVPQYAVSMVYILVPTIY